MSFRRTMPGDFGQTMPRSVGGPTEWTGLGSAGMTAAQRHDSVFGTPAETDVFYAKS
jgi:hypothetical protein